MNRPRIVSEETWRAELEALRAEEKAHTRAGDALAAQRRRLPMVPIETPYRFDGPDGDVSLLDLFEGRRQLVLYHFMFDPSWEEGCVGCSMVVDNMGHLAHLHARDVSVALVSRAPLAKLRAFAARMGWSVPWVSSYGSDFGRDVGTTTDRGETFAASVFLREGERVFRTYVTDRRGVESLGPNWSYLDLTPFGRQEAWEDAPAGRPQGAPYGWWRLHDRYATEGDPPPSAAVEDAHGRP